MNSLLKALFSYFFLSATIEIHISVPITEVSIKLFFTGFFNLYVVP